MAAVPLSSLLLLTDGAFDRSEFFRLKIELQNRGTYGISGDDLRALINLIDDLVAKVEKLETELATVQR
jgi:hypothetical protein